ncbi:hypothetical protein K7X08_018064 [Anisodus acutangulus]|uniref:O-methyltransferase C-terminal domain-containing protein n=1 Tax=Anisodus acutangulus TaxID=402998 RepID=A0A9Q1LUY6_9SOLA|nr:hypothetical protein K7X08_018064 [Anisodus acutangulus]
MEAKDVPTAREMFQAQAHIYKHAFSFANSMVLGCAIQLGIPDAFNAIVAAFPHLKCSVLDLPHVVANMPETENLKEAEKLSGIKTNGRKGKVLIIDMVLTRNEEEADMTEVKLIFDVMMLVLLTGRKELRKKWEKLFLEAGFMSYKITPVFGLRSLIEVFP